MPWWNVVDATGWVEQQPEQRGLRSKQWVIDPAGAVWLRKSIRGWETTPGGSRPSEPAVEAFTLELARRCGFDVAVGHPAIWEKGAGPVRGFISRRFHDETEEQRTGAELIEGFDRESAASRVSTTLAVVRAAIMKVQETARVDLLTPFVRTIIFDAWIGNGDRHVGNWAVLVNARSSRFAPMFDTAACLGTELLANHRLLSPGATDLELAKYVSGCKSGFGDDVSRPGISQSEVLSVARTWPEWTPAVCELYPRFINALDNGIDSMLAEVPDEWWSSERRKFARRMLEGRVKLLGGVML